MATGDSLPGDNPANTNMCETLANTGVSQTPDVRTPKKEEEAKSGKPVTQQGPLCGLINGPVPVRNEKDALSDSSPFVYDQRQISE